MPYHPQKGWPIQFPDITTLTDDTHILIHFQDSLTFYEDTCIELQKVEDYFGELSKNVFVVVEEMKLEQSYNGPLNVLWFPSFVYELGYQMSLILPQWTNYINYDNSKTWQCLNGIPKPYREKVAWYLKDNFDNGILSLSSDIPLESHAYDDVYHGKGNDNPENFLMLDWVYKDCAINIVTETVYDFRPGIFTEKTLFAFLAGQIPLVIGHAGIVQELAEMGFDMFEDVVDTSYDWLDNDQRWKSAIDLNADLLRSLVKKQDFYERLSFNKHYALKIWPWRCKNWYKQQVLAIGVNKGIKSFPNLDTFWP